MATVTIRPDGDGTYTEYDSRYPSSGGHWDKVDDTSPDDDSTYIEVTSADKRDFFTMGATGIAASAVISNVRVYAEYKKLNGTAYLHLGVRSGTTDDYSSEKSESGAGYGDDYNNWTENPATSSAWTVAEVDAMECGVKSASSNDHRVTQVYAVVTYTIPAPTVTAVTPSSGTNNVATNITITGTDFVATPAVTLNGTAIGSEAFVSSTEITATVQSGLAAAAYDVTVTNPDTQSDTLVGGFTATLPTAADFSAYGVKRKRMI